MRRVTGDRIENRPFEYSVFQADPGNWNLSPTEERQLRAAKVLAVAGDPLTITKSIGNLAQILAGAVLELAAHTGANGPSIQALAELDGVEPTFSAENETQAQAVAGVVQILAAVRESLRG